MKAQYTLDWLDSCEAEVLAHLGSAYPERELLRLMLNDAHGIGGVMSAAYRSFMEIKVPQLINRADARAYAHEVMFAADFGLDPITVPESVGALLDSAVVLHEADTDTLGELLIAAHLIQHESSAITQAKVAFDAAWLSVPREFEHYHVILVGGILYGLTGE